MKGRVEKLWDNDKTLVFEIDGEKYGMFKGEGYDETTPSKFPEGSMIEFEFVQKGQYKNISNIVLLEKSSVPFKGADEVANKSIQIIRQACLKAAVGVSKTSDEAIENAEKFVAWVMN